jgi:phosphatidylinositol 4-kinase
VHFHGLPSARSMSPIQALRCVADALLRWTFGANRVQLEVDVKLLGEFLEALQADSSRAEVDITSLGTGRSSTCECEMYHYVGIRKLTIPQAHDAERRDQNHLLRLLVENEMSRLLVWANPLNEADYGVDHPSWDPLLAAVSLSLLVRCPVI